MQATATLPPTAASSPFHAAPAASATGVQPGDVLVLPQHQRMVVQQGFDAEGRAELQLFYGDKEVCFDEPELFTFARTLTRQPRFRAADVLAWGQPGPWSRMALLLQDLLDAGVLRRAEDAGAAEAEHRLVGEAGNQPSPLAPALTERARSWHELPGLMAELTGRPLDIGHLELVVPIFRVAHMAVDAEGRQVGESNAFPAVLRLDVPTRWRTCIYSGSRYQDAKPMNVSALKSMRAHWAPMMAMLLKVRAAYLARCPDARAGWTVGHLERLSTAVLALPALQLMRRENRVGHAALHPVLSSMFRVTDSLRMTMHHMLFIPFGEPTRKPDTPMTGPEVHAYAERAFSLHSEHGVCAGPQAMIDEFLAVLVGGELPRDGLPATLEPELEGAIADIEPAIDYAMLGLQAYAAVFSFWPMTMRCYEQLHAIATGWARDEPTPAVLGAQQWLAPIVQRLRTSTHLATEAWRADREFVYGDMYAQAERTRTGQWPAQPLQTLLAPRPTMASEPAAQALLAAIHRHFGPPASAAQHEHRVQWLSCLLQMAGQAHAVVRTACAVQAQTNRLLGRSTPAHRFTVADIDIYVQLVGMTDGRVPFLPAELERVFGFELDIDADGVRITDHGAAA